MEVIFSRRLTPAEQAEVARYLVSPVERAIFWDQPSADQQHGLAAARSVVAAYPDRMDMVRAALLHDIGKRHSRLGPVGRTWAVVCGAMGCPSERAVAYLDHGKLGSDELAGVDAEPLVVAYALHHHGTCPDGVSPEDWTVLQTADRAVLPSSRPVR